MHTLRINKSWTIWTHILISVAWLIFLVPCVGAVSIDQQISHECPHCPSPENDPCHGDSDRNKRNIEIELEDHQRFAALPS